MCMISVCQDCGIGEVNTWFPLGRCLDCNKKFWKFLRGRALIAYILGKESDAKGK